MTLLVGRRAICNCLQISWDTVRRWAKLKGLPVVLEQGMPPTLLTTHLEKWQLERLSRTDPTVKI